MPFDSSKVEEYLEVYGRPDTEMEALEAKTKICKSFEKREINKIKKGIPA